MTSATRRPRAQDDVPRKVPNRTSDPERAYRYLGDRSTDPALRHARCVAVTRDDGRCICGRGAMLVRFEHETTPRVVVRRCLRKLPALPDVLDPDPYVSFLAVGSNETDDE